MWVRLYVCVFSLHMYTRVCLCLCLRICLCLCLIMCLCLCTVFAADGHTYEKLEMERWLQTHETSVLFFKKNCRPTPPFIYKGF